MPRARVPLPTLLSQILIALTINLDNEFEQRAIGPLHQGRLVVVESDPQNPRQKLARLTPEGAAAKAMSERPPGAIEQAWTERFGDSVAKLRTVSETIVAGPSLHLSPLGSLIRPHPDGWRSWVKPPGTLPHHPQPNHQGAYPDGV